LDIHNESAGKLGLKRFLKKKGGARWIVVARKTFLFSSFFLSFLSLWSGGINSE
jgi:hypothetical protein